MLIGSVALILFVLLAVMIAMFIYAVKIYEEAVDKAPLIEKKEHLLQDIASAQNTLSDIKAQMQSLYAELANANQVIAEGKTEREWLNKNRDMVANLRKAVDLAKQDMEHVNNELNHRQDELKQKNIELQELTGKVQQLSLECERQNAVITENSKRVIELKDQITQYKTEEIDQKKQLELIREERRNADIELHQVQDEVQMIRNTINPLKEEFQRVKLELERMKEEKEKILQDCQKLLAEKQGLNHDTGELSLKKQQLEKDINAKHKNIEELKATETNHRRTLDELQNQCLEQERALNKLASENEKLQNASKDLAETKQKISELNADIINKEAEIDRLTGILGKAQSKVSSGEHQWEDLNREVPFVYTGKNRNQDSEQNWLENFKNNLDQNGIRFNDRMINAFHTGLKVADYSPLVVLAGISGTGKSLLPRLYAHAMGMNFLQVAVQPRWDGPQDMFGFYNYMEGRYKATELSRLLWQFDSYNNKTAAEKYKNNPPMNLVLLDEMNLARVEYYFSDLLSKLEVRRGLDPADTEKRLNAEIEIECGASEKNSATRRLFVGSNFLFVGTMNEDETTQTLSDKVVDRSNVLRFGRPKELNAAPAIKNFYEQFDERTITEQQWQQKWIIKENPQRIEKLEKIMNNINSQLELLGRPFAHRVWQAMKAYVSNYPVAGEQGFRNAVADQIEMKILPKLNGLEKDTPVMQEVLKFISFEIDNLKDEALFNTFDAMCKNDDPFFQWRGVMR